MCLPNGEKNITKSCSFSNTDYRAQLNFVFQKLSQLRLRSVLNFDCDNVLLESREILEPEFLSNILLNHLLSSLYHSKLRQIALHSDATKFNFVHQLLSPHRRNCNRCRFEIRTLEDTFQNYYYCC
jgi:hypothetical protein